MYDQVRDDNNGYNSDENMSEDSNNEDYWKNDYPDSDDYLDEDSDDKQSVTERQMRKIMTGLQLGKRKCVNYAFNVIK